MRIVIALGGNALQKPGEPLTMANQQRNVRIAATALAPIIEKHDVIITHGSGPQIGLLAYQAAALNGGESTPLDVLDAEAEGQIGYQIEQELRNVVGNSRQCVTLLTQIEVNEDDPAFSAPSKPIGQYFGHTDMLNLKDERGWQFAQFDDRYRRVVASPAPKRILALDVIRMLLDSQVVTICAGGGGIPAVRDENGLLKGIEAVIDKDLASSLLARESKMDALIMLTDVDCVHTRWNEPNSRRIRKISPKALESWSFASGTMGPKIQAASEFVEATNALAGIGALTDLQAILSGDAGTLISKRVGYTEYWD